MSGKTVCGYLNQIADEALEASRRIEDNCEEIRRMVEAKDDEIHDLRTKIEELEKELAAMERFNEDLEQKIEELEVK